MKIDGGFSIDVNPMAAGDKAAEQEAAGYDPESAKPRFWLR